MAGIVSLLTRALVPSENAPAVTTTQTTSSVSGGNPFANPFVSAGGRSSYRTYAQNRPVSGGYFAGYYNNKPNIVGQRLFVEV